MGSERSGWRVNREQMEWIEGGRGADGERASGPDWTGIDGR